MAWYMVVVARIPVVTPEVLEYSRRVHELVRKCGGEYVILGGADSVLEGAWPDRQRLVVSRWASKESMLSFWNSAEYQDTVKPLRSGTGQYDVAVFEASSVK